MEARISCNFHCRRLERHWKGYWPGTDPDQLASDIMNRLAAATAAWGLSALEPLDGGVVALTCAATQVGRPVVLKLNPRGHPDDVQLAGEGEALAFWRPTRAAVELIDRGPTSPSGAAAFILRAREGGPEGAAPGGRRGGPRPPRPPRRQRAEGRRPLEGHRPEGGASGPACRRWALIDPVALESLPEDAGAARATAERWIERYADAAEMDPGTAMDWTCVRARVEAGAADDAAWAAALNRMADALG
jgi:hypothetical protein